MGFICYSSWMYLARADHVMLGSGTVLGWIWHGRILRCLALALSWDGFVTGRSCDAWLWHCPGMDLARADLAMLGSGTVLGWIWHGRNLRYNGERGLEEADWNISTELDLTCDTMEKEDWKRQTGISARNLILLVIQWRKRTGRGRLEYQHGT